MCHFYQTKPKVVQAIQCGKATMEEVAAFTGHSVIEFRAQRFIAVLANGKRFAVYQGEWLVKDDHGNISRMIDADFQNTYSAVESSLEHM